MGCRGGRGPVPRGVTCRNATGRGRRSVSGSPVGRRTGPGLVCWSMSRSGTTSSEPGSGGCPSTPRSTVLTSMPPAPAKGGGGGGRTERSGTRVGWPGARPVPRWADDQGPSRLRRSGPASGRCRHARQRQRLHRLRHGHDRGEGAPDRRRASPPQARGGYRGQGVLVTGDPPGPARAGHPGGDPAEGGVHLAALTLWLREPTQDRLSDRPQVGVG